MSFRVPTRSPSMFTTGLSIRLLTKAMVHLLYSLKPGKWPAIGSLLPTPAVR